MELDITAFFNSCAPMDFSASVAEIGQDAGRVTWGAALKESRDSMILDTQEKREAFRKFVRSSGAWDDAEIKAWSEAELNALCVQWIAGDMREPVGFELGPESTDAQWEDYREQCENGNCAGRIYRGTDGLIYFYIGD